MEIFGIPISSNTRNIVLDCRLLIESLGYIQNDTICIAKYIFVVDPYHKDWFATVTLKPKKSAQDNCNITKWIDLNNIHRLYDFLKEQFLRKKKARMCQETGKFKKSSYH